MPQSNFKLSGDGRRALALLAESPKGCTEMRLLTHGFAPSVLAELADFEFTTANAETTKVGRRATRFRITASGRLALGALSLSETQARTY
jgi:hypothetical protein